MTNLNGDYTVQQLSSQRFLDAHEVSNKKFSAVTRAAQKK